MSFRIDDRVLRIAIEQHGLVTREQLAAVGVGRGAIAQRLRAGVWTNVGPGVVAVSAVPESWEQTVARAVLSGPRRVASHATAAHLLGLHRAPRPAEIDVTMFRGHVSPLGVRFHETVWLPKEELVEVGCIPTTSAARTIVDLVLVVGRRLSTDRAHDAIRRGMTDADELRRVAEARSRLNGVRLMRKVIDDLHPDVANLESPLEVDGLSWLSRHGFERPVLQLAIRGSTGRFIARVDAAYPDARVAVEFDGRGFHSTPGDVRHDRIRDDELRQAGWRVVRVRRDEMFGEAGDRKAGELRRALDGR